jgi:hypothetical protein
MGDVATAAAEGCSISSLSKASQHTGDWRSCGAAARSGAGAIQALGVARSSSGLPSLVGGRALLQFRLVGFQKLPASAAALGKPLCTRCCVCTRCACVLLSLLASAAHWCLFGAGMWRAQWPMLTSSRCRWSSEPGHPISDTAAQGLRLGAVALFNKSAHCMRSSTGSPCVSGNIRIGRPAA